MFAGDPYGPFNPFKFHRNTIVLALILGLLTGMLTFGLGGLPYAVAATHATEDNRLAQLALEIRDHDGNLPVAVGATVSLLTIAAGYLLLLTTLMVALFYYGVFELHDHYQVNLRSLPGNPLRPRPTAAGPFPQEHNFPGGGGPGFQANRFGPAGRPASASPEVESR